MRAATAFAKAAGQIAKTGCAVTDATGNAIVSARRTFRKGYRAADSMVRDVSWSVRKRPMRSVGITAGAAFGAGVLLGWLKGRR